MSDLPHWKRDAPKNEEQRAAFLRALALAEEFTAAAWALAEPAPPPEPYPADLASTDPDRRYRATRLKYAREAFDSIPRPTPEERQLATTSVSVAWMRSGRDATLREDMDIIEMVEWCATVIEPDAGLPAVKEGLDQLAAIHPGRFQRLNPGLFAQAVENWKGSGIWLLPEHGEGEAVVQDRSKWGWPLRRLLGIPERATGTERDLPHEYRRHREATARAWRRRLDYIE